ncbi:MAG TPA: TonB-dependent receptor, partial [Gemmatimonadales bacterium]|nr:TonB-dependent receptor [Gemmatimonadales bacterium]
FCAIVSGNQPCARTVDLMTEMRRINNVNADTVRTPLGIVYNVPNLNDLRNIYQAQIYPGKYYNSLAQVADRHPTSLSSLEATGKVGSVGFYVSGQYTDDPGAVKFFNGSTQRRGRLNLDYSARPDLTINVSTMFDNFYRDQRSSGIFGTLLRGGMPGFDYLARDTLGRLLTGRGASGWRPTGNGGANPLYDAENTIADQTSNRFLGSVSGKYFPASWITFDANFGYDNRQSQASAITVKGYRTNTLSATTNGGNLAIGNSRDEALNTGLAATLRKSLRTDLQAKLRVAGNYDQEIFSSANGSGNIFLVKEIYTLGNTSANKDNPTSSAQTIKNAGISAALNLDFKDRYILDASWRYDGSSLFGPGHRWAPFNRIAGVWIASNEPWWHSDILNQFRLRASRGTAGTTPRFTAQYEVFNVGATGISTGQAGNKALRPETTTEYETGAEFELFKRFGLEFTYAQGKTKDQILSVLTPASIGYS